MENSLSTSSAIDRPTKQASSDDCNPRDTAARLGGMCRDLKAKANLGTLTLQDEAAAMEKFSRDDEALWLIAEACLPDETTKKEKAA